MNTIIIEQYLQFAIDNWYKKSVAKTWLRHWKNPWSMSHQYMTARLIKIITSKEFIEAIVKWVLKLEEEWKYKDTHWIIDFNFNNYWLDVTYHIDKFEELIEEICKIQAIFIMNNKFSEFITNLLNNE